MSAPDAKDIEIEVPRWSAMLWLLCTLLIAIVFVFGFSASGLAWLLTGAYIFFVLPMIYAALALLAETLSVDRTHQAGDIAGARSASL